MLVIHAGPHKTATTYIQENLSGNAAALDGAGWLYPALGEEDPIAHHTLAHNPAAHLAQGTPFRERLDALGTQAAQRGRNIVLSAEGFCRWTPDKFHALADILGQDRIDVVYVIRDPIDVIYSYWAEEVKQGFSVAFPDRLLENLGAAVRSRLMNPMVDLAPWLKSPRIRLHAIPYEGLMRAKADIFVTFCEKVLGVAGIAPADSKPRNAAYPIGQTEFLRLLTQISAKGKAHIGPDLRQRFVRRVPRADHARYADLVVQEGTAARREIQSAGLRPLKRRVETLVSEALAPHWVCPVDSDGLYKVEAKALVHYDSFILWQQPAIREAVENVMTRIGAI